MATPTLETVDVLTTQAGDLIISLFSGPSYDPENAGVTPGDESTLIDSGIKPYTEGQPDSVIVEFQFGGDAGINTSTATFDTDVSGFLFAMSLAFKHPPLVPEKPPVGPLSMSNFVPYS
jgi:hypothetical protein